MIRGRVSHGREAVVDLAVTGPSGTVTVPATIDTGFTASLALPDDLISTLRLVHTSKLKVILADGTTREIDIYSADIFWAGAVRTVLVSALGSDALIGMTLLAGHRLVIDVEPDGLVELTPLKVTP
jgi:clan AA aspartic protease